MIDRRTFLIAGAAFALGAHAQVRSARIGYLASSDPKRTPGLEEFRDGMRKLGWVEGKNLQIDYRWTQTSDPPLKLAEEIVRTRPDLIFTWGSPATAAAQRATATIPIVFTWVGDPVGARFVASLARPGGNLTGMSNSVRDLSAKNVTLFAEAVPGLRKLAIVWNPDNVSAHLQRPEAEAAARGRGLEHALFEVRKPADFAPVFSAISNAGVGGVVFLGDPVLLAGRQELAKLALQHRLPSIYNHDQFTAAGGLMSYGADAREVFRRTATYVDKVLRGAKPGDLPVEQPNSLRLVVNLKTAKALGLTFPQSLLVRADQVIQ